MASRIQMIPQMIAGSSIDPAIVEQVHCLAAEPQHVLVCLVSNHQRTSSPNWKPTLRWACHKNGPAAAASSSTPSSKTCPPTCSPTDRSVVTDCPGDNPKTAVHQYLKTHPEFDIDKQIDHKLLISVAPDGDLKRVA